MNTRIIQFEAGNSIHASEKGVEIDEFAQLCNRMERGEFGDNAYVSVYKAIDKNKPNILGYGLSLYSELFVDNGLSDDPLIYLVIKGKNRVILNSLDEVSDYLSAIGVYRFVVDTSN